MPMAHGCIRGRKPEYPEKTHSMRGFWYPWEETGLPGENIKHVIYDMCEENPACPDKTHTSDTWGVILRGKRKRREKKVAPGKHSASLVVLMKETGVPGKIHVVSGCHFREEAGIPG